VSGLIFVHLSDLMKDFYLRIHRCEMCRRIYFRNPHVLEVGIEGETSGLMIAGLEIKADFNVSGFWER